MTRELTEAAERYEKLINDADKPILVVLTGAGISAESGIPTFRDANGLWEGHDIYEVASPQGWAKNPQLVLDFYNLRREAAANVIPNAGHHALAELEKDFLVIVVTQNVDALHEKAGSTNVIHLHGELSKVRSTVDDSIIYDIGGKAIQLGDVCEKGGQLRPHIVWFGEDVPFISIANQIATVADFFMVVGTSMQVYPAAGMVDYVQDDAPIFVIDRKIPHIHGYAENRLITIEKPATEGVPQVAEMLNEAVKKLKK